MGSLAACRVFDVVDHDVTDACVTRVWRKGVLDGEDFPLAEVSDHLADPDTLVWVDLCNPSKELLDELAVELGLHELAVEDALGEHQRPKLDKYETHSFLSCHAVRVEADKALLVETEIDAFINPRYLITVRKDDEFSMTPVLDVGTVRRTSSSTVSAFLLYGLLDVVIDGYFDTVESFDEYYDTVSEALFADEPLSPDQQRNWFEMRRALVRFHRLVVPMREAISGLMRREHGDASRGPLSLLPGRLRPHPACQRVDRLAPGPRLDDRRNQHQPARLPPEPGHEAGHQLGRDHRRPDAHHRVVRTERPVPRLGRDVGRL